MERIIYCMDEVITCGGVISVFEHVKELKRRGMKAEIMAKGRNRDLEDFYNHKCIAWKPDSIREEDVVIAVWWKQMEDLKKGRRYQFVQGRDIDAYATMEMKEAVYTARQNKDFYPLAVSNFAGDWLNRVYSVVPNGVSERFYSMQSYEEWKERPIEWLIEGNNEPNKNIDEAISFAKKNGGSIAWMGREVVETKGVLLYENPKQEDIPKIYGSAKRFVKLSKSEGFSLSVLEAMASGCIVYTRDMGGNDFCDFGYNCFNVDGEVPLDENEIRVEGLRTAWEYTWENSIDKLLEEIE